ncbi:MAG: acetyl-CoA carboxylase carboxyltransferase subunit alpha [Syntrophomonadaceae bacterium]|nr:acetyl-CoA carboxylase carboxyltransferase subunit alpha [Syntrophomonadaceae bacterium]
MNYTRPLEFEKDYLELKNKVEELKALALQKNINLNSELEALENRMGVLQAERYNNLTAWQIYQMARHQERPFTLDYINAIFQDFIELHGDRCYADDSAVVGGLAWFDEIPVTVLGHQKGKDTNENLRRNFGMAHPEGYRKAYRLMEQAEKFGRPLICFIDTPGAYPGTGAEERGQAWAISRNLARMSSLRIPIISLVIGEGGSGGALALGVADRVLMLSYAVYSVISPYGCASILLNDANRSEEMAEKLKMTAPDLLNLGIIDEIIPEPLEGAHRNPQKTYQAVEERIRFNLRELLDQDPADLVERRYQRLRKIGRQPS